MSLLILLFLLLLGDRSKKPKVTSDKKVAVETDFRNDDTVSRMAATTSFRSEKRCHPLNAHASFARRLCSSVRQFLIYSTFVRVLSKYLSCHVRWKELLIH